MQSSKILVFVSTVQSCVICLLANVLVAIYPIHLVFSLSATLSLCLSYCWLCSREDVTDLLAGVHCKEKVQQTSPDKQPLSNRKEHKKQSSKCS